jgi:hypothetical protein
LGSPQRLYSLLDRLEKVALDRIEVFVDKAATAQAGLMADLNREQLNDGIKSDGTPITPAYKPRTIEIKKRKGQPYNKVTLLDKGPFQAGIKASKKMGVFELESTDSKEEDLKEKYSEEIEGLTEENLAKVSKAMLPSLIRQTKNYLVPK